MSLSYLDITVIVVFILVNLSIGLYFSKKASKSLSNYFLGGRNLPWWIAGTSMVATTFAADTPLAVTELVAQNGIAGNWLWWNMLAGGMLTTFFFSKYWRRANIMTDVELISIRYSGRSAKFLRSFKAIYIGIFLNAMVMGWVNLALMSILQVFFGIPESDLLFYVAGILVIVAIYTSFSGFLGVAFTDILQFVIAMGGSIILAVLVVNSDQIGGIEMLKSKLPSGTLNFFPTISSDGSNSVAEVLTLGIGSFLAYAGMQWWASWYPGAEPGGGGYVAQRMMSAKNEKHSVYATLFFQIAHYCIRPWPWIIVALCCIVLYPNLDADSQRLGYVYAMKDFLPSGLKGLLFVAFLAAYMSTISTQLNWGVSYVINDFVKTQSRSNKQMIQWSRLATIILMFVSILVTSQINSISGIWIFIIESGAGVGLVLILRWYWWRINAWSEIVATIAPFIGYAITKFILGWEFPDSFFFILGFTTVAWLIATFITKPVALSTLESFYQRIQPIGNWSIIKHRSSNEGSLGSLIGCWLSSIVLAYSILFLIGSIVLLDWDQALSFGISAVVSFVTFRFFIHKSAIFKSR